MSPAARPRSYDELVAISARLEAEEAHHLVTQQELIRAKGAVDRELMRFRVIQEYTARALTLSDETALSALTLEAIIEAFELEIALLLRFDGKADTVNITAEFGLDEPSGWLPFSPSWLDGRDCMIVDRTHPLLAHWHRLGLAQGIIGSFADKDGQCAGMIAAGITEAHRDFYEPIAPAMMAAFALMVRQAGAIWATREFNEEIRAQNRRLSGLTQSYSRFVPFEFLRLLGNSSIEEVKAGDHVPIEMTVLFADLRGSTSLGERLDPAATFAAVNEFFVTMEPLIQQYDGLINQYLGDAIMALFTGGDHARAALSCAAAMAERARSLNAERASAGGHVLEFGIGISSGKVILGAIGGGHRLDSNVIGDPANLASRTEDLTKLYRSVALFTEYTLARLATPVQRESREIDRVMVRGRQEPASIFELLDAEPEPLRRQKIATVESFGRGLAAYRMGDLKTAFGEFVECVARAPDDAIARLYLERCQPSASNTT